MNNLKKFNLLFIASSKKWGLHFNFSRLAIALKEIGHKVIVVSELKEQEKGLFDELTYRGIKWHTVYGIDNFLKGKIISSAKKIGKIIENYNVDVVHAQGIRQMLIVFIASKIFCRKKKIGIVVSIHTILHGRPYENVTPLIESFLLNICADIAMPVANSVANKLVAFGLFPKKVITIYNGIDLRLFDEIMCGNEYLNLLPAKLKSSSYIIVGYFAKMTPRKGHKYLIKSISEISKEFPNIMLVITSTGPLVYELKTLSKNLGIEKNVLFTGKIEYNHLYQLLKRIDIYAFPSLADLFPFAILEAMAAGKPIVATNVGGIPEVIKNGETGILIPPKDSKKLAESIRKFIKNPEEANKMGFKCRKLIEEQFDIQKIAYNFSNCYELCIKRILND